MLSAFGRFSRISLGSWFLLRASALIYCCWLRFARWRAVRRTWCLDFLDSIKNHPCELRHRFLQRRRRWWGSCRRWSVSTAATFIFGITCFLGLYARSAYTHDSGGGVSLNDFSASTASSASIAKSNRVSMLWNSLHRTSCCNRGFMLR